jgi:23S rRNA pseudouridine1911/1915/1917 synthase
MKEHDCIQMPSTLLMRLTEIYPLAKRQTLKRMAAAGRVSVNGRAVRKLNVTLSPEDEVLVSDEIPKKAAISKDPALDIIYEDADLLVVNKPAGLLTSTVPREPRETLLAIVRKHVGRRDRNPRIGLIHRLDRDASGLLVFSKNDLAYQSLKTQFFKHTVKRLYLAIVHGVPRPAKDIVRSNLVERADGSVHSTTRHGKGQLAVTEYQTIRPGKKYSLVRVTLHTGRKHQIRVHLSERGFPIAGDSVYGSDDEPGRLMLAAIALEFVHPRANKSMKFEIAMPPAMAAVLEK